MELFSAISKPLGVAILLNVGGMILSKALQIARILLKPEFDPRVIGMATPGMLSSPAGTVLSV
jgi:hypothetical protein